MERLSCHADLRVGVQPDHRIDAPAPDVMLLTDYQTGELIAMAVHVGGWLVFNTKLDATRVAARAKAITALTEHALGALGGTGYSTLVPHEVAEML